MFLSRVKLKADIAGTQLGSVLAERSYGFHKLIWDLFDQVSITVGGVYKSH